MGADEVAAGAGPPAPAAGRAPPGDPSPAAKRPRLNGSGELGPAWCADLRGVGVLAPMVRVGCLPFRLLAARYGAGVVFTEELIAQKVAKTERVVDAARGVVEYVLTEQHGKVKQQKAKRTVVFSTPLRGSRSERPEGAHVVLQLGANDPEVALRAARHVEQDVDGIDLNMGCPKAFSVKGGMGAALLTQPEKVGRILGALVGGLCVPVSCKIRLLENTEQMAALLTAVRDSGVRCLSVHARHPPQRSSESPHYPKVAEALRALQPPLQCPVLISGDIWEPTGTPAADAIVEQCGGAACGVQGVMVARGALLSPGVFAPVAERPSKMDAHRELMRMNLIHSGAWTNMKYVLTRSFQEIKEHAALYAKLQVAKDIDEAWAALGMDPEELQRLMPKWVNPQQLISTAPPADAGAGAPPAAAGPAAAAGHAG
eukprot:TRINITY_DN55320_c0_g1_i1.p1 TRINITY_DN55320_c0_g1~~TRINITY_DN55320_c0_g1_i1.p1  ORF type:complete len:429 (+),score=109.93 TRINITY_DN55320_c0_g1_i1:69-1355(+)